MAAEPASGKSLEGDVESQLAGLRPAFQADGADLRLLGVTGGQVSIELVVTDETCLDCIVAPPMLAAMVEDSLLSRVGGVTSVVVHDPR